MLVTRCCPLAYYHTTTTILWPFFGDHLGEPVPGENFWTLWCKGRLTEADTSTIRLGTTPSRLTSAHLHHPPFFTAQMPFLPPNQQCQSTEGILRSLKYESVRTLILRIKIEVKKMRIKMTFKNSKVCNVSNVGW